MAGLLEARSRARGLRLQSLLRRRLHVSFTTVLRRWQLVSLVGVEPAGSEHVPIVPADGSISRVVSLQRQLLARETQLAAAQQTALRWRGEKADLERRLSATYAQAQ